MADYAKVEKLIDRYDRAVNGLEADVIGRLNDSLDASYRNLEQELRRLYPTKGGHMLELMIWLSVCGLLVCAPCCMVIRLGLR